MENKEYVSKIDKNEHNADTHFDENLISWIAFLFYLTVSYIKVTQIFVRWVNLAKYYSNVIQIDIPFVHYNGHCAYCQRFNLQ